MSSSRPMRPDVAVVRVKYRVGESLRVLYRWGSGRRTVAGHGRRDAAGGGGSPTIAGWSRIADVLAPTPAFARARRVSLLGAIGGRRVRARALADRARSTARTAHRRLR